MELHFPNAHSKFNHLGFFNTHLCHNRRMLLHFASVKIRLPLSGRGRPRFADGRVPDVGPANGWRSLPSAPFIDWPRRDDVLCRRKVTVRHFLFAFGASRRSHLTSDSFFLPSPSFFEGQMRGSIPHVRATGRVHELVFNSRQGK